MSHIRNLFHEPSGNGQYPLTASPVAVAQEGASPPDANAVAFFPEFPVEEAHISPANRLVFHVDPRSPAADRFRFLRMRLQEHWAAGKLKKLLVISPLAYDGKSTVVMNLATALLEHRKRSVLVIEADLHHASLAVGLKLDPRAGLAECLRDPSISPLSHIRRVEPLGWHFLPAGEPGQNPTELLQTPALGVILQKLSPCFDWVLIDSPPVIPLIDAIALQQHADASLLVVRAGRTPRDAVEQTIALLGQEKIVGIVLNGVERRNQPNYQQRYYGRGALS